MPSTKRAQLNEPQHTRTPTISAIPPSEHSSSRSSSSDDEHNDENSARNSDSADSTAEDHKAKVSISKKSWSEAEDVKLQEIVAQNGASKWSTIAYHLPGRMGKQCRERWFNHLCPEVKKGMWTVEEDRTIMDSVAQHGTKWSLIVKSLPGRTDNAIKNRYNSAMRRMKRLERLLEEQKKEASKPPDPSPVKPAVPPRRRAATKRKHDGSTSSSSAAESESSSELAEVALAAGSQEQPPPRRVKTPAAGARKIKMLAAQVRQQVSPDGELSALLGDACDNTVPEHEMVELLAQARSALSPPPEQDIVAATTGISPPPGSSADSPFDFTTALPVALTELEQSIAGEMPPPAVPSAAPHPVNATRSSARRFKAPEPASTPSVGVVAVLPNTGASGASQDSQQRLSTGSLLDMLDNLAEGSAICALSPNSMSSGMVMAN